MITLIDVPPCWAHMIKILIKDRPFCQILSNLVSVLLSALVERFSVSRLQNFFFNIIFFIFCSSFPFVLVRFGIGATIRTRQEIQCLPQAEFLCFHRYHPVTG